MSKTMHILFGFDEETSISNILKLIRSKGYEVKYTSRITKESITAYLSEHTECEYAVLRESNGSEKFSVYDFVELTDYRDINIVAIIDRSHKGMDYMHSLYAAGIVNAIFSDGKKGAQPAAIAQLLMNKRTRKKARHYYGIDTAPMRLDILTYETFNKYYTKLMDESCGINMVDRYIGVVNELSVNQAADFTMRIPAELRKKLSEYEEFFYVMDAMKRQGVEVKIQKPAHLKRALTDEQFTRALNAEANKTVKQKQKNVAKTETSAVKQEKEQPKKPETKFEEVENVFWNESETESDNSEANNAITAEGKEGEKTATTTEDVIIVTDDTGESAFSKKPCTKVKWKYVLYTLLVGLLLVAFWYFLMMLMRVY